MRSITFELCAETIDACLAAKVGGAHRIELCSALSEGGLTPSHGLVRAAIAQSGLPVHMLIRPRGGNFFYTQLELDMMRADIEHAKSLGAAGVVFGALWPDATVDLDATRSLVELARPMQVTFHRAIDVSTSITQSLEDVIACGCDRVLTSGGEPDVVAGSSALAALVKQAAGRIEVALGSGLRAENAASVRQATNAASFHGSFRKRRESAAADANIGMSAGFGADYTVDAQDIRNVIDILQNA